MFITNNNYSYSKCSCLLTIVNSFVLCSSQNRPLPAKPIGKLDEGIEVPNQVGDSVLKISDVLGNAKAEWTLRHLLDGASLLAKCCQVAIFINHLNYIFMF